MPRKHIGLNLSRSISGGEKGLTLGSNGTAADTSGGVGLVPDSATNAYTLTLETVSRSDDLSIAAGSSAELVASQINAFLRITGDGFGLYQSGVLRGNSFRNRKF